MGVSTRVMRRACLGTSLSVGLISAAVLSAPLASADTEAGAPASDARTDHGAKPFAPGSVQIDASTLAGGGNTIRVSSDPLPGFSATSVAVATDGGDLAVAGVRSKAVADSRVSTFKVSALASSSDDLVAEAIDPDAMSTVTATVQVDDGSGAGGSIADRVWVSGFDGATLVSETGEQDLRLQKVARLEDRGGLDAESADALRQEILGATGSEVARSSANACVGVCASGTIRWTDAEGGTHPVPFAPVELRDGSTVVGNATTALDGTYAVSVGAGGTRNISVRVLAKGQYFDVGGQFIQSTATSTPNGTDLVINLTANNTTDNNTAFSLQNAMYLGTQYLDTRVPGGLRFLDVVYPDPDGSFYDEDKLHVLSLDRFDWDVMLHEYGHFVANELDIENNPGGDHSSADNLSVARGSKAIGVPLAFGEGWPTYFAVSLLQVMGADALNVPNAGDDLYQDTEDQVITDNLETGGTLGEDNEFTVMSVLWDLYDANDDGLDTVSLGDQVVWDRLVAGGTDDPGTLADAYRLLALGGVGAADPVSCVFSGQNVAPRITAPTVTDVTTGDPAPTITWIPGNGATFKNNSFVVELRDSTGDNLLFASPAQSGLSYTPSNNDWQAALGQANGTVRLAVVGTQTAAPVTGPYRSCLKDLTVSAPAADVVFSSDRDGNPELYVMKTDGTDQARLTTDPAADLSPAWSPDGAKIAWTRGTDIWTMNADGTNQQNVTTGTFFAASKPAWTKDATQLVFTLHVDPNAKSQADVTGHDEIWKMNADGSSLAAVATFADTGKDATDPAVSASDLVFFSLGGDLFKSNLDGTGRVEVLAGTNVETAVDLGNTGTRMAFTRSTNDGATDVVSSRLDGTDKVNLTATAAGGAALDDLHASFGPDDTRLVFASTAGGDSEIWKTGADGTGAVALTDNAADDTEPDWRTKTAPTPAYPCLANPPSPAHGFGDIPSGAYYNDSVSWLVASSITTGVSPGNYGPTQKVTRGQLAAFLWRTVCEPTAPTHTFGDVAANAYYHDAVSYLAEAGVTNGTSAGRFSPNQKVTRGQMATFLWRLAGEPTPAQAHTFGDVPANSYYNDAVSWLVEAKVTTGTAPGVFGPNDQVDRGQMAAFLDRFAN